MRLRNIKFGKMKLCFLIIYSFLICTNTVRAQNQDWQWAKSFGGLACCAIASSIATDSSGNIYTTGSFQGTVDFNPDPQDSFLLTSIGYDDIFVSKFDSEGNFIWTKSMGGTEDDECSSISVDSYGNIYMTGFFSGTADFDPDVSNNFNLTAIGVGAIFIVKLDSSGSFIWARIMGGPGLAWAKQIQTELNENVYTVGFFTDTVDFDPSVGGNFTLIADSSVNPDIFICKLDRNGNFVWAKSIGGTDSDIGEGLAIDTFANVFVTGSFKGTVDFDPGSPIVNLISNNSLDIFVCKFDSAANFLWAKAMGGSGDERPRSIKLDPVGNIYTSGYFAGTGDFNPDSVLIYALNSTGLDDIYISKLNNSGDFVWAKSIGGTNYENAYSLALDSKGRIYTTGFFRGTADFDPDIAANFSFTSSGSDDAFVSILDSAGTFLKAFSIGGLNSDIGNCVTVDSKDNMYLAGGFRSAVMSFGYYPLSNSVSAGNSDNVFVAKLSQCSAHFEILPDSAPHNWLAINQASGVMPITYTWSWGDSTSSGGATPSHSYSVPGNYNICLGIVDAKGCSASFCDSSTFLFRTAFDNSMINVTVVESILTHSIELTGIEQGVFIYPNPATTEIKIDGFGIEKDCRFQIYDMNGRLLIEKTGVSAAMQVNVSTLPVGVYMIRLHSKKFVAIRKLIIAK